MSPCIELWVDRVPNQGYRLVKFGGFHEIHEIWRISHCGFHSFPHAKVEGWVFG